MKAKSAEALLQFSTHAEHTLAYKQRQDVGIAAPDRAISCKGVSKGVQTYGGDNTFPLKRHSLTVSILCILKQVQRKEGVLWISSS
jgi:hypothetical protein